MEDFKSLNLLVKNKKNELNSLYDNKDAKIITKALKICEFTGSDAEKIAVIKRIVDLKEEGIVSELEKQGASEKKIDKIKAKIYEFVRKFYVKRHANLIKQIKNLKLLSPFNEELLSLIHEVGVALSEFQKSWQKTIVEHNNKELTAKFKDIAKISEFTQKNKLFQKNSDGSKCDRSYGAMIKIGRSFKFKPYAAIFPDEIKAVKKSFKRGIKKLEKLAKTSDEIAYLKYLKALKVAFSETKNNAVIARWQDAERAWMKTKGDLQIGHPLEYYEDAYFHAVAPEWDIRLKDSENIDEKAIKSSIKDTFELIYKKISAKNENMKKLVHSNIDKTQLYVSSPMIYYAADFNGLFSAQVVPNDEIVSRECGKKIFAFVNFIYESAKSKPFMKLSSEIFEKDFLDFGREILFKKPQIWKKVYEISTIGHEFGHILFIDADTEGTMNKGGEFKFIEEYKATTGGLVNFFLHEKDEYKMPVFHELIKRAVGLIGWQKVPEVRAYYCEGLIHLGLLFGAGVLEFTNKKLKIDFSSESYDKFKALVLENYEKLAAHYVAKKPAGEFLANFAEFTGDIYLPKDNATREFVEFYYFRYEKIANEIDDSGEREKWKN